MTAQPDSSSRGQWIALAAAAKRMGLSVRQLSRRCSDEWAPAGLARMQTPAGGGRACWHVHPSVLVRYPEQMRADLSTLSDEQRRLLAERERIVKRWEEYRTAGIAAGQTERAVMQRFLEGLELVEGRRLGRSTLFEWRSRYRREGLAGLIDGRWVRNQPGAGDAGDAVDDAFVQCVLEMYLKPQKRPLTVCYAAATVLAQERGWTIPSCKTVQRRLAALPPQLIVRKREGEQAFKTRCEPAIERDYTSLPVNGIWSSDHRPLDVMCRVGMDDQGRPRFGRPNITIWQDVRSRKVVGFAIYANAPNSDVILRSLADAVRAHGVPGRVELDNGRDYDSRALQGRTKAQRRAGIDPQRLEGAFTILQIDVGHVWKYHGQSKPAEAQFRTMSRRFDRLWDTWTGHTTAAKPQDLGQQLARGKAPTVEELSAAFAEWLAADYNAAPHGGHGMDGRSPDEVFAELLAVKRTLPEELLAFACMPRFGPVTVRKQGVTYRGLNFGAFDERVQRLFRQKVMLAVDPDDLSRVLVIDLAGKLICAAAQNQRVPFNASSQDLRTAIAEKKRLRKTLSSYNEQRPRMALDVPELLVRHAAQRARAAGPKPTPDNPPSPPSLRPHRTVFDDQLPAIRRELEQRPRRLAAGAESMGGAGGAGGAGGGGFMYQRSATDGDGDEGSSSTFTYPIREVSP